MQSLLRNRFKHYYLIITYAIVLHWLWAICLMFDSAAGNATSVHTLLHFMTETGAIATYIGVALLSFIGLFYDRGLMKVLCLLPQQFLMMVSAGGALYAMYLGQFADGVQRSHAFIIADQSPAVIAAILHTVAICLIAGEPWTDADPNS